VTRLIALTGVTIISFSAILVRLAETAPTTAGFFRAAYAIPLLWVLRRITGDDRSFGLRRLALASGVFLAVDVTLWHTSIDLIGAGLSTVVANTQVLWVGVLAWLIHRERPTPTAFVIVPIVLLGVALVGGVGSSAAYGSNPGVGAALALGAGLFYAGFLLLFREANTGGGPTTGPLLDVSIGIAVAIGLGGWLDPGFSLVPEWPAHGWLLALGLGVHTGGWLLIAIALPRLPALETSVMLLLQPALTLLWAMILFSETLSGSQWVGTVLVLVGITIAASRGLVRPADEGAQPGS
jgi:drug/metabolite transporter (DMT)-like permease